MSKKVIEEVFQFTCHQCKKNNLQTKRYPSASTQEEAAQLRMKMEIPCKHCGHIHPPGLSVNGEFNLVPE